MQTEKTVSCFDRPLIAKWSDRPLASLTTEWLEDVQETLHDKHGFDAYRKFRAYGNAALNWAQEFKRRESGLDGRRWWLLAEKRRRKSKEVTAKLERDKKLKQKKAAFQVGHLGEWFTGRMASLTDLWNEINQPQVSSQLSLAF